MAVDPQIQALRDFLRADHEAWVAEVQAWADEAAAAGDLTRQRRHLAHVARLNGNAPSVGAVVGGLTMAADSRSESPTTRSQARGPTT